MILWLTLKEEQGLPRWSEGESRPKSLEQRSLQRVSSEAAWNHRKSTHEARPMSSNAHFLRMIWIRDSGSSPISKPKQQISVCMYAVCMYVCMYVHACGKLNIELIYNAIHICVQIYLSMRSYFDLKRQSLELFTWYINQKIMLYYFIFPIINLCWEKQNRLHISSKTLKNDEL